ncbi:hypothetical protein [Embleya sp. NPDC059237]|uniref:hypothetical protein n=1 Tax=Embleya sp. NPDC059237 TaxID=3346784 RepID=UPI00368EBCA5
MTRDLLVLVPTRGRPHAVAELLDTWHCGPSTDLLLGVDDDDPELPTYRALVDAHNEPAVILQTGPRLRLGGTLNALATEHATHYRAIAFMGDDHRPRTIGWDTAFLAELDRLRAEHGAGLVYGDDLLMRQRLPTAVALTSNIVTTLGRMVPTGLIHLYLDNYWLDLGHALDAITWMPNVIVEHVHPSAGKAAWDDRYDEVNAPAVYDADQATYEAFVAAGGLDRDATAIRAANP